MKIYISNILTASLVASTMLITSCGKKDTVDSLSAELAATVEEISSTMDTVKDKESAQKAAKRIGEIGDEFVSNAKRLDALGDPTDEDKKLVGDRMSKAMRAMNKKREKSLETTGSVEAAVILGKAIEGFGKRMKEVEETLKKFSS